jgi:hypothetical protein
MHCHTRREMSNSIHSIKIVWSELSDFLGPTSGDTHIERQPEERIVLSSVSSDASIACPRFRRMVFTDKWSASIIRILGYTATGFG